jgi:L-alanine-DL-glutamate epimerase-like enolase superfamily enzyme
LVSFPERRQRRAAKRTEPTLLTIESIETIPVRIPLPFTYKGSYYRMRNRCAIVTRVRTAEGIVGEAYNADEDEPLQSEIRAIIHEEIAPLLEGQDAMAVERCWQQMLPVTFDQLRPRWYAMQAMAAVDTAIWDAFGKAVGQPLWRLWGGFRDRVPVIGIGGYYVPTDGSQKGNEIEDEIDFFKGEHGMVGMKFNIGARTHSTTNTPGAANTASFSVEPGMVIRTMAIQTGARARTSRAAAWCQLVQRAVN